MTFREHLQDHLHKSATHHAAVAELHKKISKTHGALARLHDDHAEKAAAHRDLKQFHASVSEQHDDRQKHFAALHEKMGGIGDSELLSSQSDAADDLRQVADGDLFKRFCGIEV